MSPYQLVLLVIFVILLAVLVVLFLPLGRTRNAKPPRGTYGPIDRQDPKYWMGGLLYNTPDDPDVLVPKRFGFGWTINFGHPGGKVFLVIAIAMILLPIVIAIVNPGFAATGCHPSTGCHL